MWSQEQCHQIGDVTLSIIRFWEYFPQNSPTIIIGVFVYPCRSVGSCFLRTHTHTHTHTLATYFCLIFLSHEFFVCLFDFYCVIKWGCYSKFLLHYSLLLFSSTLFLPGCNPNTLSCFIKYFRIQPWPNYSASIQTTLEKASFNTTTQNNIYFPKYTQTTMLWDLYFLVSNHAMPFPCPSHTALCLPQIFSLASFFFFLLKL